MKETPSEFYAGEAKIEISILGYLSSLMYLVHMKSRFRNSVVSMPLTPAHIVEID